MCMSSCAHWPESPRIGSSTIRRSPAEETVLIVVLAIVLGPSVLVFLAGCIIALYRTLKLDRQRAAGGLRGGKRAV